MATTTAVAEPTRVTVGFHYGNVIQYLAEMCGTGFEVLRELGQNAFDKGAKHIFIKIDCMNHIISVFDDGDGASANEIIEKFSQIGLSLKLGQPGMMGQKGIGNLAAFVIGRTWQLITRDIKAGGKLHGFTFDKSELTKSSGVILQAESVPFKLIPGAPFPTTTVCKIVDVDDGVLRQLGDKVMIERTLREAFNSKLRGDKISLRVSYRDFKNKTTDFVVKATKFRGTPLESVEYDTEFGYVSFEFYHSHEPIRDPSILVFHQGVYSVPLSNFFKLKILPAGLEPLFTKGYFEGQISLGFCKLNSSRSAFEYNDEQKAFAKAVEDFSEEILQPLIEQFEQSDRKDRLKKIAEGVLKKMKQFLNKYPGLLPPNLKSLLIKTSKDGIGGEVPDEETVSIRTGKSKRASLPSNALKVQRKQSQNKEVKPRKPMVELRDGLAIQVINPEAEEGFSWHSRLTPEGIIQVNAMNNEFTEAERRGQSVLTRYMFLLVQKELTCASLSLHDAQAFNLGFEKTFMNFWKVSLSE